MKQPCRIRVNKLNTSYYQMELMISSEQKQHKTCIYLLAILFVNLSRSKWLRGWSFIALREHHTYVYVHQSHGFIHRDEWARGEHCLCYIPISVFSWSHLEQHKVIELVSFERHDVSNPLHFDCTTACPSKRQGKHQSTTLLALYEGNPSMASGFL